MQLLFVIKNTKLDNYLFGKDLTYIHILYKSNNNSNKKEITMKLIINNLDNYAFLSKANEFNKFDGEGSNISPSLRWQDYPEETKSFALTVYDPDAPTGSGFWHWIAYDIPTTISSLPEDINNSPSATAFKQAMTDYGFNEYSGPCPPKGDIAHRYIFKIHALNCESLNIDPQAPNAVVRFILNSVTIDTASVTVLYKR